MLAFLALTKCKFSKFISGCQLGLVPGKTRSAIRETDAELFAALKESGSPAEHRFFLNDQPHVLEGTPYTAA